MKITVSEELYVMVCSSCGVRFALPESIRADRQRTAGTIWCPNGDTLSYKETEADVLRRERDRLTQKVAEQADDIRWAQERCDAAEKSAVALRGQVTKLKKRAANGVCPCCTRSFTNLRRHMETKHPEFTAADNVVALKAGA